MSAGQRAETGLDQGAAFRELIAILLEMVPEGAALVGCERWGDPQAQKGFPMKPIRYLEFFRPKSNNYLCQCAVFPRHGCRETYCFGKETCWHRESTDFAAGLLLMIDDLTDDPALLAKRHPKTGKPKHYPLSVIDGLPPTALIETSPGNFQAYYVFDAPVLDAALFRALIEGFINKQGYDTGMAGINRIGRPGFGVNGKEEHKDANGWPFRVRFAAWDSSRRYSPEAIAKGLGISLASATIQMRSARIASSEDIQERIETFNYTEKALERLGLADPAEGYDADGWRDIDCPWMDGHSGKSDAQRASGTAIREPSPLTFGPDGKSIGNDWYGSFKCFHGGCIDKKWRDLTEWISEQAAADMNSFSDDDAAYWAAYLEKDHDGPD